MLSQKQHVLPAMTLSGGHSMTTVSAAVHRENFYSYSRWMEEKGRHFIYQNNAKKLSVWIKEKFCVKFVFERAATKCTWKWLLVLTQWCCLKAIIYGMYNDETVFRPWFRHYYVFLIPFPFTIKLGVIHSSGYMHNFLKGVLIYRHMDVEIVMEELNLLLYREIHQSE